MFLASWPVTIVRLDETLRDVRGVPAAAAAAVADVMPGMISNEIECSISGSISSRSLAKIVGSPPFRRTTVWPFAAAAPTRPD